MATPNSLRKKTMAAQALPRRQSVYQGMEGGSSQQLPPPPRVRPMDKSKVESLMKRRYSTRGMPAPVPTNEPFPAELSSKTKAYDVERKNVSHSRSAFSNYSPSQANSNLILHHFVTEVLILRNTSLHR